MAEETASHHSGDSQGPSSSGEARRAGNWAVCLDLAQQHAPELISQSSGDSQSETPRSHMSALLLRPSAQPQLRFRPSGDILPSVEESFRGLRGTGSGRFALEVPQHFKAMAPRILTRLPVQYLRKVVAESGLPD